jgi:hypothetical protein
MIQEVCDEYVDRRRGARKAKLRWRGKLKPRVGTLQEPDDQAHRIARRLHKETTKIADAFGLICVGNVSGRWLQATNGKSSADASTKDVSQHAAV